MWTVPRPMYRDGVEVGSAMQDRVSVEEVQVQHAGLLSDRCMGVMMGCSPAC